MSRALNIKVKSNIKVNFTGFRSAHRFPSSASDDKVQRRPLSSWPHHPIPARKTNLGSTECELAHTSPKKLIDADR
jgi:hypothetical protein